MKPLLLAATLLWIAPALPAQQGAMPLGVTGAVDWQHDQVTVEVTRRLDRSTPSLIQAKADAETAIQQGLPDAMNRALGPLRIDSSHVLSDYMLSDPTLARRLVDAALEARMTERFVTPDFSALVERYVVPFFGDQGIGAPFFPSQATPIRRRLGDVITRPYTGVLIVAQGPLPAAGTSTTATARPALFPRIWDEQMNLVLDRRMCFPEALAKWGMVGYSQTVDDPQADLRVGNLPLRLAARGVFGDSPTDIVISMDGARQLLAIPENITLLQQGRILIVYDALP